eukprot:scaffold5297_cov374-Prasinococcus_capsulatus_cf.AAC.3
MRLCGPDAPLCSTGYVTKNASTPTVFTLLLVRDGYEETSTKLSKHHKKRPIKKQTRATRIK